MYAQSNSPIFEDEILPKANGMSWRLCCDIRIVIDGATLNEVRQVRKKAYKDIYPDLDLDDDNLDFRSIIAYTRDEAGEINSTARFILDGPEALLEDLYLTELRQQKKRLLEWGRFIIVDNNVNILKAYYSTAYTIATNLHCDAIVMAMKQKDISFHQRLVGAKVLCHDMGISYGGQYSLACVLWEIAKTKSKFFKWIGVMQ